MKAEILQRVTLTVEPGSIVEVSESQFLALGALAKPYKEEAKVIEPEVEEAPAPETKKTSRKSKK